MDFAAAVLNAFLALLAILNPIGNLPAFVDVSAGMDARTRRRLFNLSALVGFVTLLVLSFCGRWVMEYVFAISIADFRIAGGILLLVIAARKISASPKSHEVYKAENAMDLGVVPLAVPLMVGPGAIVTGIIILDRDGPLVSLCAIVAVYAVSWVIMQASSLLSRLLGHFGIMVLSRILWIFIAAIGVKILTSGIIEVFAKPA